MLDYRYIYVFKVRGQKLYKIGISKDWKVRRHQIEDTKRMRMHLRILIAVPLIRSGYFEQRLHDKFANYSQPLKGVSGGTEFFRLNSYDGRIGLRGEVLKYFLVQMMGLVLLFVIIGLLFLKMDFLTYFNAMIGK